LETQSLDARTQAFYSAHRWSPRIGGLSALVLICLVAFGAFCGHAGAQDLRIEHVTIVSPERASPLPDATVFIHDGRISSVTSGGKTAANGSSAKNVVVINGRGLYLSPGLIDTHVHTGNLPGMTDEQEKAHPDIASPARDQIPRSYLYFGFTTLLDLISTPAAIKEWNARDVHPDIYFCGGAPIPDGYPMNWAPKPQRYQGFPYMIVERGSESTAPAGIDPATHTPEAVVARMKSDGAVCVKTFYERGFGDDQSIPAIRLDTERDVVSTAHADKMPVFIHANGTEAQTFALDAGVDVIAHGLWHWNKEPKNATELTPSVTAVLDRLLQTHVGWQPTMQVLYGERDLFDPAFLSNPDLARVLPADYIAWCRSPEGQWFHDILSDSMFPKDSAGSKDVQAQWNTVRGFYAGPIGRNKNATNYLATRGAHILFGTDTPSAPTYANPPGLNGWIEMHRLLDAGLTPAQIFRAATIANAESIGLSGELGTVESGKRANLLLLRKNPAQTVDAYDEIVKVILHGRPIDRSDLAANRSAAAAASATH
jgi:imidazolonepropionase-like amidohydrolase